MSDGDAVEALLQQVKPIPVPDEPNLYQIPAALSPIYRQIPLAIKLAMWIVSAIIAAADSQAPVAHPLVLLHQWRRFVWFLVKTVILGTLSTLVVGDVWYGPSRVKVEALINDFSLPSRLSRYDSVKIDASDEPLGVHYLEYRPQAGDPGKVIYLNHGFGASSLSWLPVLPKLANKLAIGTALGHDAMGFGFSQRSRYLELFTLPKSAAIATALIQQRCPQASEYILLGHSMGALTTLQMALQLGDAPKRIVLVAPAFGVRPTTVYTKGKEPYKQQRSLIRSLIDIPLAYVLRRVVGLKSFWRKGLELVWGNSKRLKDSDVLRFQWPAIGYGWEPGLLDFAQAQALPTNYSDRDLLKKVLELPRTTVSIILGSKDRIVSPKQVRSFLGDFATIKLVELDGLGHDPFEEDVERFLKAMDDVAAAES